MSESRALHLLGGLALLLATTSCLEREEELRVEADGSVQVVHTIRGQGADIDGGEAGVPSGRDYTITRTVENAGTDDEKDDEKTILVATARYASVAALPDRFEDPSAEHSEASLRFPTELRIVEEADGRHFILTRRYLPREWARFDLHHRRAFPTEMKERLERQPPEELTDLERREVLSAFAEFERGKWEEWLRDAVVATFPAEGRPLLAFHAGRAALVRHFAEHASPEQLEALLATSPEEIERASREFERALDHALLEAVAGVDPDGLGEPSRKRFLAALAGARRSTHVTEDLGDETFIVRVRLPGRVIAHNADGIEDGFAVWIFDGQDLRDREQRIELHTVSP